MYVVHQEETLNGFEYVITLEMKKRVSMLIVTIHMFTSNSACSVGLATILVIMHVSTLKNVVILYRHFPYA
jgi:hypothetical protein